MSDDFEIIFYTELGSCVSEVSEATDIGSRVSQAAIKVWDTFGYDVSAVILDLDRELGWGIRELDTLTLDFDSDVPEDVVDLYIEAIGKWLGGQGVPQHLDFLVHRTQNLT